MRWGAATATRPSPLTSQSLLFPWCSVLGWYPSELPQLHQRGASWARRGMGKKTQKKGKKERREPCFSNHNAHWGFSCRGEGEVNNFVYHGFIFFPLLFHFTASFVSSFSFFWSGGKAGWLMQIPSLFTLQSHPSLFWEGSPPVINSQQN